MVLSGRMVLWSAQPWIPFCDLLPNLLNLPGQEKRATEEHPEKPHSQQREPIPFRTNCQRSSHGREQSGQSSLASFAGV
eukprot:360063-Rhodomonas_salina.1